MQDPRLVTSRRKLRRGLEVEDLCSPTGATEFELAGRAL